MNTEHDWLVWWHDEGSGMRPVNGQDHESHVRDMTRIAWLNGAFGAAEEIERLRAERDEARHGESVAIATLQGVIEERRMIRFERDEARVEVCRLSARCVRADYLLRIKNPKHVTEYDVAESRGWHDLFADEGKHERTT